MELLYRVARTFTGQPVDAEDLVQETLIRAFRAIESFDGRYPGAWLLTIMRNAERNRHRRDSLNCLTIPILFHQFEAAYDSAENPEHAIIDCRFDTDVERAFRELPGALSHDHRTCRRRRLHLRRSGRGAGCRTYSRQRTASTYVLG